MLSEIWDRTGEIVLGDHSSRCRTTCMDIQGAADGSNANKDAAVAVAEGGTVDIVDELGDELDNKVPGKD